ncbi:tRNA dihydrouridine synthase DusB [Desulfatiferula olefinivorans]
MTPIAPLTVGSLRVHPPVVLAPLAGITSLPFRLMARRCGCGLVYSEMISANGLKYGSEKTAQMMDTRPEEGPVAIQIFGADPAAMAMAARRAQDSGASMVDINFGCSVKKVVKTGAGVALMREPHRAEAILTAVRKAVTIPLTIKIRSGWDPSGAQAFAVADLAERCGVDAVCIHPRTAGQAFRGRAHWPLIGELKGRMTIPVIGNGDIASPDDALRMIRETGCDAVMIGRAALSDPDIFRRTALCFDGRPFGPLPLDRRFSMIDRYVTDALAYHGETVACKLLRSRLAFLIKGLPGCTAFRIRLSNVATETEVRSLMEDFQIALDTDEAREHLERMGIEHDGREQAPGRNGKGSSE